MGSISPGTAAVAVLCVAAAGCSSYRPADIAQPPRITLREALVDVVDALNAARERSEHHRERTGLNPCGVTAVFNVAARATDGGRAELGLSVAPPVVPVGVTAAGELSRTAEASRGNVVTVHLTSPACLPEGTLGATRPDRIVQAQEQTTAARGMALLLNERSAAQGAARPRDPWLTTRRRIPGLETGRADPREPAQGPAPEATPR